jgi:hypothetical protein
MKRLALFFLLALGAATSHVQAQNSVPLLQDFMRDMATPSISDQVIMDTYLCRYLHDLPNKEKNQGYATVKYHMALVRESFKKDFKDLKLLKIYPYAEIPTKDKNLTFGKNTDIYACYYKNSFSNYISVIDGKIEAFTTINKAGQRFLLSYCE